MFYVFVLFCFVVFSSSNILSFIVWVTDMLTNLFICVGNHRFLFVCLFPQWGQSVAVMQVIIQTVGSIVKQFFGQTHLLVLHK